jgi:hypothetical protein
MPIVEVIKPIVDYKVNVVTQQILEIHYSPMNYDNPQTQEMGMQICSKLNAHVKRMWENDNMDYKLKELVKDACIAGESHFYSYYQDDGEKVNGRPKNQRICFEKIDMTNIMFGDENEDDNQKQPYILIVRRELVRNARDEARANHIPEDDVMLIRSDEETDLQAGDDARREIKLLHENGKDDDSGKCLIVMVLWRDKKTGTIHSMKATKTAFVQHDTDHKTKMYPVVSMIWQRRKGTRRGIGEVNKYVANQLWANRAEAYRLIAMRLTAFPKLVYVKSLVKNPQALAEVGAAIAIDGKGISDINQAIGYLNPSQMSADAAAVTEELIQRTREGGGASDAAIGNVDNPHNYSAIFAVQQANRAPLNDQTMNCKFAIEGIARVYYDMSSNYFTNGLPVVVEKKLDAGVPGGADMQGQAIEQQEVISQADLKQLIMQIKVDVSPDTAYDRLEQKQQTDNFIQAMKLTPEEANQLMPDDDPYKTNMQRLVNYRGIFSRMKAAIEYMQKELDGYKQALQQVANQAQLDKTTAYKQGAIDTAAGLQPSENEGNQNIGGNV